MTDPTQSTLPATSRLAGPLIIALATVAMLTWSWKTWPDPLVDFGAQLYVPWQISAGHVLYRDIAYYNGPLSSYFDATVFRLFGVGLNSLVWANLLILAVAMTLAYRLTVRASGRLSATMAGLTFALIFAFGQVVRLGNYNWLTPYTHEVTHGVVLGLAAIACASRYQQTARLRWIVATGGLLGAVFLTKAEPTAASFAAVAVMMVGNWWMRHADRGQIIREISIAIGCAIVVPLIAWALLAMAMPPTQALRGVLGSWPWAFDRRITALHFYRDVAGLDDIAGNLRTLLKWSAVYVILIGSGTGMGIVCRPIRARLGMTIGAFIICSTIILARWPVDWSGVVTPLPICLAIAFIITAMSVLRRSSPSAPLQLALIVFAAVLVAKMGLKAYPYHYGFVLAWPATAVLVCIITAHLPAWIDRRGGSGWVLRAVGLSAWLAAVWAVLLQDARHYSAEQSVIAAGTADEFRGDQRAVEVQQVSARISQLVPPTGTVVVLPQGLMINYLTRRASPTRYTNFMPPEVLAAGESAILAALNQHPPDVIVLTPAVIENGYFTLDDRDPYGAETLKWVMRNYVPADEAEMKRPLVIMVRRRD